MTAKETQIALLNAIKIYAVCKRKDAEWRYNDLLLRLSTHEETLCREQRAICVKHYAEKFAELPYNELILNAPMPDL